MPKYRDGNITIVGHEISKVVEARHKLHFIASEIRSSQRVMQFISIPTLSDEIKNAFLKFKVYSMPF